MGGFIETYRKQWPRVGAVLGMAVAGATALSTGKTGRPRALAALNFGALLLHQYEEYVDPGWFPGQFNHGVFKSKTPRNYPLNTNSALCVNTVFAYPFYIAPILFPKIKWLGLAPVLFGMTQAVGHGVIFPRIAGDKYSPGFLASILLHTPIGIAYIRGLKHNDGPITRGDWAKAIAYQWIFAAVAIGGPNLVGRDHHSPYAFEERQKGPHTADGNPAAESQPPGGA
ncbi:MAG: HXXEE domain-containing protein [Propionibacteriaceae bacterium]